MNTAFCLLLLCHLYRNEMDKKNESLMQRMNTVLYNIEAGIRIIHNARTLKDIEENLKYLFRTKAQTFEQASKKEIGKRNISDV